MTYGFDKIGGFFVIDPVTRKAAYAYPTSIHADNAKANAEAVAERMMKQEQRFTASPEIVERTYLAVVMRALAA